MAKNKKSSGNDLGVGLLIRVFQLGLAWAGRFLTEIGKNTKVIYQKSVSLNTQFDTWFLGRFGRELDPISKSLLIIFYSLIVIPITIILSILKSF